MTLRNVEGKMTQTAGRRKLPAAATAAAQDLWARRKQQAIIRRECGLPSAMVEEEVITVPMQNKKAAD